MFTLVLKNSFAKSLLDRVKRVVGISIPALGEDFGIGTGSRNFSSSKKTADENLKTDQFGLSISVTGKVEIVRVLEQPFEVDGMQAKFCLKLDVERSSYDFKDRGSQQFYLLTDKQYSEGDQVIFTVPWYRETGQSVKFATPSCVCNP